VFTWKCSHKRIFCWKRENEILIDVVKTVCCLCCSRSSKKVIMRGECCYRRHLTLRLQLFFPLSLTLSLPLSHTLSLSLSLYLSPSLPLSHPPIHIFHCTCLNCNPFFLKCKWEGRLVWHKVKKHAVWVSEIVNVCVCVWEWEFVWEREREWEFVCKKKKGGYMLTRTDRWLDPRRENELFETNKFCPQG